MEQNGQAICVTEQEAARRRASDDGSAGRVELTKDKELAAIRRKQVENWEVGRGRIRRWLSQFLTRGNK